MGHDEYRRCTFHSRANLPIQKRILINLRHVRHVRCNPIPVTALWKTTLFLSLSPLHPRFFFSLSRPRVLDRVASFRLRDDYEAITKREEGNALFSVRQRILAVRITRQLGGWSLGINLCGATLLERVWPWACCWGAMGWATRRNPVFEESAL